MFATHTQANYMTLTPEAVKGCFYIQFDQILQMRAAMEEQIAKCSHFLRRL